MTPPPPPPPLEQQVTWGMRVCSQRGLLLFSTQSTLRGRLCA